MSDMKAIKIIVDDDVPVSTILEALNILGYQYTSSGVQCIEDVEDEMKDGIWLVAPDQGPCRKGEAYEILIPVDEPDENPDPTYVEFYVDELKTAVKTIEYIYRYLNTILPLGEPTHPHVINVVRSIRDTIPDDDDDYMAPAL